jgi:hypothetical protein
MPMSVSELLRVVDACKPDLDAWQSRCLVPELPAAGSLMDDDDRAWSFHPLSASCWSSLVSAVDHLQVVRDQIERRNLRAFATFSLTRGALLSAAQAVWLLCDDSPTVRQRRAAGLAKEFYDNHDHWADEIRHMLDVSQREALARSRIHTRVRLAGLRLRAVASYRERGSTEIVRVAARAVFPGDVARQRGVVAHWRSSSADAHGQGWGPLTRGASAASSDRGIGTFVMGGDLRATVEHFKAAYLLTGWAWRRWDQMRIVGAPAVRAGDR